MGTKQKIIGLLIAVFSLGTYWACSHDSLKEANKVSSFLPASSLSSSSFVPQSFSPSSELKEASSHNIPSSKSPSSDNLITSNDVTSIQKKLKQKIDEAYEQGYGDEIAKLKSNMERPEKKLSPPFEKIHPSLQKAPPYKTSSVSPVENYPRYDSQGRVLVRIFYQPGQDQEKNIRQMLKEQNTSAYAQLPREGVLEAYLEQDQLEHWAFQPWVLKIIPVPPVHSRIGSVTTEADQILGIADVREGFLVTGRGINVGVISSGVDHLEEAQYMGDLPEDVTVLANGGWGSPDDEGTAMLEIIHDLAPEANLYFHDGGSETRFIEGVRLLKEAGCDIIVDDLAYVGEPFFEDGPVAQAVQAAVDSGVIFVSAAGNDAEEHVELPWSAQHAGSNDPNLNELLFGYPALVFPSDEEMMPFDMGPNHSVTAILQWSEPFGASSHDYDLKIYRAPDYYAFIRDVLTFLDWILFGKEEFTQMGYWTDSEGIRHFERPTLPVEPSPITVSDTPQTGKEDPLEIAQISNSGSEWESYVLVVEGYQNMKDTDTIEMFFGDSGATGTIGIPGPNGTPKGSIFGHPAVPGCLAVGAVNVNDPGLDSIERYSSQGPSYVPFSGTVRRNKPDLVSVDGVSVTGAGNFPSRFYGTSAAAPHVAAFAALLKDANPNLTPKEVHELLTQTATDLGETGQDNIFGFGMADMESALKNLTSSILTVDSTMPSVEVSFRAGQKIDLKCMAAIGKKNWILLEVPNFYPGLTFARPSNDFAYLRGRYFFLFKDESNNLVSDADLLYFSEAFEEEKIDFGINDLSGIGKIIITTLQGANNTSLEKIQQITLTQQ